MQPRNVEEVTLDLTIDGYGAMSELVEAGKVRYLDISGRRSSASGAPAPCTRSARCRPSTHCGRETSKPRSPALRELGIDVVQYSDLGRGFLSGAGKSAQDLFETGSERLEAASTAPATDETQERDAARRTRALA